MVDELRHAFELAHQQPEEVQRHSADVIARALDEREWHALVESDQGQVVRERLAAEARADSARGDVEGGGWE